MTLADLARLWPHIDQSRRLDAFHSEQQHLRMVGLFQKVNPPKPRDYGILTDGSGTHRP